MVHSMTSVASMPANGLFLADSSSEQLTDSPSQCLCFLGLRRRVGHDTFGCLRGRFLMHSAAATEQLSATGGLQLWGDLLWASKELPIGALA